ncbi:MAG: hypothetical protein ACM35G_09890, partial [Planctomycetaceae bacterium]
GRNHRVGDTGRSRDRGQSPVVREGHEMAHKETVEIPGIDVAARPQVTPAGGLTQLRADVRQDA